MGGYGGSSGKGKTKTYYDTGGHKVKDSNAVTVAEYFIDKGRYVAFLQEKPPEKRADLLIEGIHTEVKGMSSLSTNKVANNIKEAFEQVAADNYRYSPETNREGQVIILSKYPNLKTAYKTIWGGYRNAKGKGYVQGNVWLMHDGKLYKIGGR
jgi:hypothetical protein